MLDRRGVTGTGGSPRSTEDPDVPDSSYVEGRDPVLLHYRDRREQSGRLEVRVTPTLKPPLQQPVCQGSLRTTVVPGMSPSLPLSSNEPRCVRYLLVSVPTPLLSFETSTPGLKGRTG